MFSLFKKSEPTIPYSDKIWMRAEHARKGLLMMAMMQIQQGKACLVANFFESEIKSLSRLLTQHQLDFVLLNEFNGHDSVKPLIYLLNTKELSKSTVANFLKSKTNSFSPQILFTHHYPINSTEQAALKLLQTAGFNKFTFCLSFDDALLKSFGTQEVLPLLEKLGLTEEEAIEHAMVTQSIKRAREKIEEKLVKEILASSPEEWFALNVKK